MDRMKPHIAWCNGCYMPTGVLALRTRGRLAGPQLAAGCSKGRLSSATLLLRVYDRACLRPEPANTLRVIVFGIYVSYVTYEALAAYDFAELKAKPICYWGCAVSVR